MVFSHDDSCPSCSTRRPFRPLGIGAAAGVVAAATVILGRKVIATASIGRGHPLKHRILDAAAGTMQHKYPLDAMSTFLNGFHFYADDMGRQVEACHFCIHLQHDLHQCIIFDSNKPNAKLIGIEYIISKERFQSLPDDEKRLWHSHHFEVKSGELIAPGIPELAERTYFKDLVTTYGKTFHNWQVDKHDFPYGIPQLMMGFTEEGQLNQNMRNDRDRRYGISTADRCHKRSDIPTPDVAHGANSWESGRTLQTRLEELNLKR